MVSYMNHYEIGTSDMKDLNDLFLKLDENKDGKISKEELSNILSLKMPKVKSLDLDIIISKMDAN